MNAADRRVVGTRDGPFSEGLTGSIVMSMPSGGGRAGGPAALSGAGFRCAPRWGGGGPGAAGAVGGPRDVVGGELQLRLALGGRALEADERVEALAPDPLGELERDGDVLAEAWRAVGIARQAAVARRHVAGVEVEQRDREARVADRGLDLGERLARGPPELDGREAGGGGALEALQERRVLEEHRDVGAELHSELSSVAFRIAELEF